MSSSVAADVFRIDDWDHAAAEDTADGAKASPFPRRGVRLRNGATAAERTPPWPQRRLNDALADLGPARPEPLGPSMPWPRVDAETAEESSAALDALPDVVPEQDNPGSEPETNTQERADLPPPPRPFRQPLTEPLDASALDDVMLRWDEATLSDVDPVGADIVRALAMADSQPVHAALPRPPRISHSDAHYGERERPPMIIERALAEQGLGMMAAIPAAHRINPVPALAAGFSLSVLIGVALYLVIS